MAPRRPGRGCRWSSFVLSFLSTWSLHAALKSPQETPGLLAGLSYEALPISFPPDTAWLGFVKAPHSGSSSPLWALGRESQHRGPRAHHHTSGTLCFELRDTFAASLLMIIAENYDLSGPDGLARSRRTVGA